MYLPPVLQLNAIETEAILAKNEFNLFIEVYAPWCEKCSDLKVFLQSTAQYFEQVWLHTNTQIYIEYLIEYLSQICKFIKICSHFLFF